MNDETRAKVATLPKWARELINQLEQWPAEMILDCQRKQARITHLEERKRVLEQRCEAMVMFFQCAEKGGSQLAAAVADIVKDFLPENSD